MWAENWPYMPTISPEGSDRVDEELAHKEKGNDAFFSLRPNFELLV